MLIFLRRVLFACIALNLIASVTLATENETILTVSGLEAPVSFDIHSLELLGTVTFATSTIWTSGEQVFIGVPLLTILKSFGVESGTLRLSAINDYSVEIPVTDAVEGGPIIATRRNGSAMSVRDKGPLWIVYPYDTVPEYQSEVIYSRSIWQLDRIYVMK